jgi:hypothetical protein
MRRSAARGVGAFVLFLVLYTIIGAVIGAVALVGVALILWLVANLAPHFIHFPERADWTVYHGLVQTAVAVVVAWVELPPLMPRHDQLDC